MSTFTKTIRSHFSPFFLTRHYLLSDIKKAIHLFGFYGSVIDIGCGQKPYKPYFTNSKKYVGIDFKNYSVNKDFFAEGPDLYFDEKYKNDFILEFKDQTFDNAVSFQTLEHHPEPLIFIKEIVRITKDNGLIMISVPFIGGLHEEPHDYQRYTKYGLIRLLEKNNCKVAHIKEQCSLASSIVMLLMEHLNSYASLSKINYITSIIVYPFFLSIAYLALFLDKIVRTEKIVTNYLIVARK